MRPVDSWLRLGRRTGIGPGLQAPPRPGPFAHRHAPDLRLIEYNYIGTSLDLNYIPRGFDL